MIDFIYQLFIKSIFSSPYYYTAIIYYSNIQFYSQPSPFQRSPMYCHCSVWITRLWFSLPITEKVQTLLNLSFAFLSCLPSRGSLPPATREQLNLSHNIILLVNFLLWLMLLSPLTAMFFLSWPVTFPFLYVISSGSSHFRMPLLNLWDQIRDSEIMHLFSIMIASTVTFSFCLPHTPCCIQYLADRINWWK